MKQLNYLRKAECFLREKLIPFIKDDHPEDAAVCDALIKDAKAAVKFVLPDGGRIFNDRLKGIEGLGEIRLPFESVLIEYQSIAGSVGIAEEVVGVGNTQPYPRRIVFANEHDDSIFVYSIVGVVTDGIEGWTMQPMCVVMQKVESTGGLSIAIKSSNETTIKGLASAIRPTGTLYEATYGDREEWAWADMSDEVLAVLELIEAMSCSNVTHEAIPAQKQNKSAIKRGALPFDEYRVLVVKTGYNKEYQSHGGTHGSPREHLRRGHIRNLNNGKRIWINSCVVNAGIGGRIEKSYDMRKAA